MRHCQILRKEKFMINTVKKDYVMDLRHKVSGISLISSAWEVEADHSKRQRNRSNQLAKLLKSL